MPKRILLADDSITIQKVVELTFSDGDYEVTAVNNGAKAIQKLAELRPDVILSDIIMPEKNGYEVCEYVKSHPDYRNIPVVLLTGTFEPFDPDRADKAGCDAVVTKPFESQSLIHKVEELIEQSRANAPTAPQAAMPESQPLSTGVFTPKDEAPELQQHDADIFSAAPQPPPPPPPAMAPSPWDEPAPAAGETRAFPSMSFDELQRMAAEPAAPPPPPAPEPEPSPWDEGAAKAGETRAFPSMSFEDLQRITSEPGPALPFETAPPPAPPAPEPSPWEEPQESFAEPKLAPKPEPEPAAQEAPVEPEISTPPLAAVPEPPPAAPSGELSDAQIDRIARRVVELISDQVVRNIAWEVIPDLAEMVVKERIKQLESEG